jgi:hypothetical protein
MQGLYVFFRLREAIVAVNDLLLRAEATVRLGCTWRRERRRSEMPNLEDFSSSNVGVQWGVFGGHTYLETSTHAFSIFFYISHGVFMFDLLLLFRCFPEVGRGVSALFSVIFISWR